VEIQHYARHELYVQFLAKIKKSQTADKTLESIGIWKYYEGEEESSRTYVRYSKMNNQRSSIRGPGHGRRSYL